MTEKGPAPPLSRGELMKLSKEELIDCVELAVKGQELAVENMKALLTAQQQFEPALRQAHDEILRLQARINELEGKT